MADIMTNANKIRTELKRMDQNIEQNVRQQDQTMSLRYTDMRIQRIQHSTLLKNFVHVMTDYSATQINYRERSKNRIKQQLEVGKFC